MHIPVHLPDPSAVRLSRASRAWELESHIRNSQSLAYRDTLPPILAVLPYFLGQPLQGICFGSSPLSNHRIQIHSCFPHNASRTTYNLKHHLQNTILTKRIYRQDINAMYNGGSSSDSKKFEQISALSITSLSVFRPVFFENPRSPSTGRTNLYFSAILILVPKLDC